MANAPITFDRFGGMDLRRDITELGLSAAAFAENVDFERASQPRRRFGTRVFNQALPATQYTAMAAVGAVPLAPSSSGPNGAGTGADDSSTGTVAWTSPGNITAYNDGLNASAVLLDNETHYLKATNFGFAIPSDSVITGIKIEVRKNVTANKTIYDRKVRLIKGGTVQSADRSVVDQWPNSSFPFVIHGSSSDLWGATWTAADINSSSFGFAIAAQAVGSGTAFVDYIRATVYYTPAASAGNLFAVRTGGSSFLLERLDIETGEVLDNSSSFGGGSGGAGQACRYAQLGTDAASYLFVSPGPDNDTTLLRWDGSSYSGSGYTGTSPVGACVAVTPWDNRLVNGGGSGGSGVEEWAHQLIFSDEGDPLTFPAANSILLHPGDSERIVEIVSWENFVFAFKQTKYFVFYGVSTDATGGPVFEYRAVLGEGCSSSTGQKRQVAVGREAVYFVNERGVFATSGGDPTLISQQIDAMFVGGASLNPYADVERRTPDGLWYAYGRLYLAFEGSNTLFVYDVREGWWTTYDLPGGEVYDIIEDRITGEGRILFSLASPDIYEQRPDLALDGIADEVQSVVATGGSAGTFTLVFDDGSTTDTTANINWDDTAADVQTALEALDNIAAGDVDCWGGPLPDSKVYVRFTGTLAETDFDAMTVGTENVTDGDATIATEHDGSAGTPIACTWISGASDLGYDAEKVIKELYITAQDGTITAALSDDLAAFPTGESKTFTDTQIHRYRGAATNVRTRLVALKLQNDTASEAASAFNPQRVTLNLLGSRGGPQEGAETS